MNLLFVCSKNKWRSRTAETIFRDLSHHRVRSAGTDKGSEIRLTEKMVIWADLIFVMEKKHREILLERFGENHDPEKLVVLDIPDDYQYMDEELITILRTSVTPYI